MKKNWFFIFFLFFSLGLTACSSGSEEKSDQSSDKSASIDSGNTADNDMAMESKTEMADESGAKSANQENSASGVPDNRKVIYTAELYIQVKNFSQSSASFQDEIASLGGYVLESNTYTSEEEAPQEGTMTFKVPQEKFRDFINIVEEGSVKVNQQTVSGQDVTEEYVDLESRLKSKKVVEERLLSFMKEAQKTEDLLKISSDLSTVQQEMEQLTGRINYLNKQTAFATITLHISENKVNVPGLENEDLNTWEKTKKQFMESLNSLLAAGSAIIVFIIGNLPMLFVLFIIGLGIWFGIRKFMKKDNPSPPADMGE
ncbi:DUF4349 domain-containing protein [Bacillus sp. UMB0893]|uniref:DUF4349 domain-containing protein n=1 Tax=Bacillus sp. UMB0893 TaxID=2066053 RepID=UPI000C7856ED|nr:DUF4349 domain-containing protein [Bacillus sp. UMB0893]PLR69537.1 DUF4349 domain-containing protein [Bacillus sp. UMB0893]